MLKKQITYHKKQGLKLKMQSDDLKSKIDELRRTEKHNDQML